MSSLSVSGENGPTIAKPAWSLGYPVLGVLLLAVPLVASPFITSQLGAYSLILGLIGLSTMVLIGYGGIVSLAQITVAGVAGYTLAILGENTSNVHGFGWPWWLVVPIAIAMASLFSSLVGAIAVRTAGIYTIMITLAIAAAAFYLVMQNYTLFNGFPGYAGLRTPIVAGVDFGSTSPFYYLCLVIGVLFYCATLYVAKSPFGLSLQAIRDNADRAKAVGFNVAAHKVAAHALSGVMAGTAGVLLAWFNGRISSGTIGVGAAIDILVITVIGGIRHPAGPFLGAVLFVTMQTFAIDLVGAERFNTLIGAVFLGMVFLSPDGVLGLLNKVAGHFRKTLRK
ncbi:MAG: branched-chain amino acid ABC transporter permease [Devosia sp.]